MGITFDIESVRRRLAGRTIEYFEILDSTMREGAYLAARGYPWGTAVVANEQTAGQGRHGHSWHSEAGSGLYVSVLLPTGNAAPAVTLALGLATAEAIGRSSDLACDLRWPNDVLLNGRKVAGILVHMEPSGLIAGIGINVNHAAFPEELKGVATSLRLESGRAQCREDLLVELLEATERYRRMLESAGKVKIFEQFTARSSYARGKRVTVNLPEGEILGVTSGLDEEGFLRVTTAEGHEQLILAGGIRAAGD